MYTVFRIPCIVPHFHSSQISVSNPLPKGRYEGRIVYWEMQQDLPAPDKHPGVPGGGSHAGIRGILPSRGRTLPIC